MTKIICFLILLSTSISISAQTQFNVSAHFLDFDQLNSALLQNDYPSIEEEAISYTILVTSHKEEDSKFGTRTGFLYNQYLASETSELNDLQRNNEVNLRGFGFMTGLEYAFINTKHFTLAPSLDVLLIRQRLQLLNNLSNNSTFNSILSADNQVETFRNLRFMFDGRINLLFKIHTKKKKAIYGLGLTGGYRLDPFDPVWKYERSIKIEIPGSKQNGVLLGLLFTMKIPSIVPTKPKIREQKS